MNPNIEVKIDNTVVGEAAKLDLKFSSMGFKLFAFAIWLFGFISIFVLSLTYLFSFEFTKPVLGLSLMMFAVMLGYMALRTFFFGKVKYPKLTTLSEVKGLIDAGKPVNVYSIFSFHLAKATFTLFKSKPLDQVTTKDLIVSLLKTKDIMFILNRLGLSVKNLEESLADYQGQVGIASYCSRSVEIAISETHHQIETGDIFVALCENDPFFKQMIMNLKLDLTDISNLVYWRTKIVREQILQRSFFNPSKFHFDGGFGRDWASGYDTFIRQYSTDLTDAVRSFGVGREIVGLEKEVGQIEEAMMRQGSGNVILVGDAGIGKKTLVLSFAKSITDGKAAANLAFKHVVEIQTEALLSGDPAQLSNKIQGIFSEAVKAGNIILYFENIGNLFSGGAGGKSDLTEVILPYLETNLHIIGSCDVQTYNQIILNNSILASKFTRVSLDEPPMEDMIRIIEDNVGNIEYRSGAIISYEAIKATLSAADKYILNIPNPEKSITLLDGAVAKAASTRGKTIILPKDIMNYVAEKYDVPVAEVGEDEKTKLLNLESIMHEAVVGHSEAINAIAGALRRARAGVTDTKKPIGSFLFLGPTGVGKTETSKALAKAYFGGEDRMIRFDMSEYQNKEDIYRLIGSNLHGESVQGKLAMAVREHPFSLILFDEIEKANRDILDIFLQILDEGHMTDGNGRKVSFTNTIIICTSNAGANLIRESIKSGEAYDKAKKELMDYLQENNIYRPEFINRFSGVIAFAPLSREEIYQVALLLINKLKQTVFHNRQVNLEIAPDAVTKLAELGYDPLMGARPMARVIQEKVEDMLASKLLTGELKQGDTFNVTLQDIS